MHPASTIFFCIHPLVLALIHTTCHSSCHAAIAPITDPKKDGYFRLVRDIRAHPIAEYRMRPKISSSTVDHLAVDSDEDSLTISVSLFPVDILRLDPAEQVLELSGYITLIWADRDLAWNSSEYGGVEMVELQSSELWTPVLSILNGVEDSDLSLNPNFPVSLAQNGQMIASFSVNLKTSCELNLMFFPFDEQVCEIVLYSLSIQQTHLVPLEGQSARLLENFSAGGEWTLTSVWLETAAAIQYHSTTKNIKVRLELKRRTTFYLVSVLAPMALFTLMNSLVFLIPPESGEKISFLISIFISNAVFSGFINGVMPRSLNKQIPLMMMYLLFMWVWSVVVFLATIFVLKRFHDQQSDPDSPSPVHQTSP